MKHHTRLARAFGYLYEAEVALLCRLVAALPGDPVIVNIGAGAGTSGLIFLEERNDSVVHTIDITKESSPYGSLEGERVAVKDAGLLSLISVRWFQHHGDSKDVGRAWASPVDMVFVDGDHTYEGCKGDIAVWVPHIRVGGILAVHDYGKEKNDPTADGRTKGYPGVDQAVDEFIQAHRGVVVGQADTLIAIAVGNGS